MWHVLLFYNFGKSYDKLCAEGMAALMTPDPMYRSPIMLGPGPGLRQGFWNQQRSSEKECE
jgi:hypothetical protein